MVLLGKPKPQRTDCPSCGAVSQWLVDDGRVEVYGTDAEEIEADSLGVCPACGEDGVVFTMPDGTTARFLDGGVVLTVAGDDDPS